MLRFTSKKQSFLLATKLKANTVFLRHIDSFSHKTLKGCPVRQNKKILRNYSSQISIRNVSILRMTSKNVWIQQKCQPISRKRQYHLTQRVYQTNRLTAVDRLAHSCGLVGSQLWTDWLTAVSRLVVCINFIKRIRQKHQNILIIKTKDTQSFNTRSFILDDVIFW